MAESIDGVREGGVVKLNNWAYLPGIVRVAGSLLVY